MRVLICLENDLIFCRNKLVHILIVVANTEKVLKISVFCYGKPDTFFSIICNCGRRILLSVCGRFLEVLEQLFEYF